MPDVGNLYNKQIGVSHPTVEEESDVQKGECLAQDRTARI